MHLETVARDCLYVNWAVPTAAAPKLPSSLRYEEHEWRGERWVMTTALLFRFTGLRSQLAPWARLSYPQMSLRLYVLDGDDVASVLFVRMLVPRWVVPMARLLGRQPADPGRFRYPPASADGQLAERSWRLWKPSRLIGPVRPACRLELSCRPASAAPGPGPDFGNWRRTVDYVRRRSRAYVLLDGGVRRVRRRQPPIEPVPLTATVHAADLLGATFLGVDPDHWSTPHSAWLCPEIPVVFELGERQLLAMPRRRSMAAVPDGL